MKKILSMLCAAALAFGLVGCASSVTEETVTSNPVTDMELADIMADILTDVVELPMVGDLPLDESNFEMYAFIPQAEGMTGLVSEAMIGSIAHSVVLVRVEDEADAADVAAEILENANPRKWICVEAEKVVMRQYGDTIALIMSNTQLANQIVSNLDALNGAETPTADVYDPDAVVENNDVENNMDDLGGHLGEAVAPLPDPYAEEAEEAVADIPVEEPAATEPTIDYVAPPVVEEPQVVAPVAPEVAPEVTPEVAPEVTPEVEATTTDLVGMMATIIGAANLEFMAESMELPADMFPMFTFIDHAEGYRAVANEAMMGSQAHSVVLVEVPEGSDVTDVASKIKANADPRKWICVEAETCEVATNGNYVLLVMTYNDFAPAILTAFANI